MSQVVGSTSAALARTWHKFDLRNAVLGRAATQIACLLMGKHKPVYDPASDVGDYVVVTNCRGVQVTGKKAEQKVYRKHTGWRLKETTFAEMMEKTPEEVIRKAVSGMLPKNKLRQRRLERLKIFPGEDHPYSANILTRYDIPTKRLRASLAARTSSTEASSPVTP